MSQTRETVKRQRDLALVIVLAALAAFALGGRDPAPKPTHQETRQ